eukprot:gene7380-9065_t
MPDIKTGRLSREELAAAALANTWTYCTAALAIGIANAMDTLISQAYGAKNYKMVGLTLQRATIVGTAASVVVAVLYCLTEYFLLLVQQDKEHSRMAFKYALYLIPGIWFEGQTKILQKYLQGQVNGIRSYGGIGYVGSPLSTSISRIIAFFLMLAYIKYFKLHEKTWFGWSKDCLSKQGFKDYLRLGVPASFQHAAEAWGFEILTILSGLINSTALDAHSVCINFTMLTYQFPSGISMAVSVRVGQLLGSKEGFKARRASWVGFCIAMCFMAVIAIIQYTCRNVIGYIYTHDEEVVKTVATILPIAAIFQVFDGGQTNFQGVVRGMGRIKLGAIANFIAFYFIGIPLSSIFTFVLDLGVKGLWWGLCVGLVTICIVLAIYVLRVDWEKEVSRAVERTENDSNAIEDIELQYLPEEEPELIRQTSKRSLNHSGSFIDVTPPRPLRKTTTARIATSNHIGIDENESTINHPNSQSPPLTPDLTPRSSNISSSAGGDSIDIKIENPSNLTNSQDIKNNLVTDDQNNNNNNNNNNNDIEQQNNSGNSKTVDKKRKCRIM